MKQLKRMIWVAVLVLFAGAATAQYREPPRGGFSQAELDQMLAPIALYPDSLLSQILTASTYPRDVAEAASWSRANSGVRGETAVRLVENEPWDPSVIALVAFPQVLAMLDERRDWTERMGEAFIAQPGQVMDTVQELRARADAMGTLSSGEEVVVQRQGRDYVIESPTPEVAYVPYYDPRVVYGTWWWPDYQPIFWNPWPGYAWRPGYRSLAWGYGITLGSGFSLSYFDWPRRYVRYSTYRPWYYHGRDWRPGVRWSVNHAQRERMGDRDRRWSGDRRDVNRDGRRDGRDMNRDGRYERRAAPQPTTHPAQQNGFFPPRTEEAARIPNTRDRTTPRPSLPTYRDEGGRRVEDGSRQRAVPQERVAPQERVVREQRAGAVPLSRMAPSQPQRVAPPPQGQPQVAAPPPQREQAPATRPERDETPSSPPQRSGGRGMNR
ncbi:MAG: DUF3300 domain-containing protein [Usitatibacter sp.]